MKILLAHRVKGNVVLTKVSGQQKAVFHPRGYRPTKATKFVTVNGWKFRVIWRTVDGAKKLWEEFGDVPCDEEDNQLIDEPFLNFPKYTDKYEIWHWFEETFNLSVAEDLMGN